VRKPARVICFTVFGDGNCHGKNNDNIKMREPISMTIFPHNFTDLTLIKNPPRLPRLIDSSSFLPTVGKIISTPAPIMTKPKNNPLLFIQSWNIQHGEIYQLRTHSREKTHPTQERIAREGLN
jgi:hypothetical protein